MSRIALCCGTLVLALLLASSSGPKAAPAPPAPPPVVKGENPGLAALRTIIPEVKEISPDPKLNLQTVLNDLATRFQQEFKLRLAFSINTAAFEKDGLKEAGDTAVVADKPLPRFANVSLDRYLRAVLERAEAAGLKAPGSGPTFVLRRETIEITTVRALREQIWGDHPGPFLPLVNTSFEKIPLEEALKELAELSEHNVILDVRVGDKAKTAVTARFTNMPLDTAVAFLAEMADLHSVLQDNGIFVTTRDVALRWEARNRKDMQPGDDPETPRIGRIGHGVRGLPRSAAQAAGAGME